MRLALGWSQVQLGQALGGFAGRSIQRWERGLARPSPVALRQYRKLLSHPTVQTALIEQITREQADPPAA